MQWLDPASFGEILNYFLINLNIYQKLSPYITFLLCTNSILCLVVLEPKSNDELDFIME